MKAVTHQGQCDYWIQIKKLKLEARQYNYADLLEEGMKLIYKNKLDEGIHDLVLANIVNPSPSIRQLLDQAYIKRGKLFFNSGNIPLAKKNFQYVSSINIEVKSLLTKIKEIEEKKWLRISDVADLVRYAYFAFTNYLDKGQDQTISNEMKRTVSEFKSKLDYTRKNHLLFSVWKEVFLAEIY